MVKKRILIFSLAYYPMVGGAEIAVKEITDRISDIEFDMVTMRFNKSDPAKEKIGNINIYRIDSSKMLFPVDAFLTGRRLHSKNAYDAIWSIMAARAGGAALFFKYNFPRVKYILTLQEGDPIEYMKRRAMAVINPFFKKIFTNANIIQAISNYLADYASIMGYKGKVEVIPNGVNLSGFKIKEPAFKSGDKIKLITTSRLVEKNGVGDIIEALKFLPANVSLDIIGTGELESELKKKAQFPLPRVNFLGQVPYEEIPKYLYNTDIFVRPSLSEGFGNSFIEAMAAGLPVIATPVGGIPDFLKDHETGLFCKVNNPESIAEKVMEYVNNPDLVLKVVKNGKEMVLKKYDWNLIANEMRSKVFDI